MATQVQNRRGTTTQHSTFTGANGELTVDTDKKTVVVHDGTTAGGAPLLRENGSQNAVTTGTSTAASFIPSSSTVPTNGVYLPAANTVGISTNSTQRLLIDASSAGFSVPLGVGVAQPSDGHIRLSNTTTRAAGNKYGIRFADSSFETNASIYAEQGGSGNNASALVFATNSGTSGIGLTSASERLRITAAGLVGIGVSSPSELLHLSGGRILVTNINNTTGVASTMIGSAVGGVPTFGASVAALCENSGINRYGLQFLTQESYLSSQAAAMTVSGTGRVGIGTTPSYLLDVNGDTAVGIGAANSNNYVIRVRAGTTGLSRFIAADTSDAGYIDYDHNADSWIVRTNGSEAFRVDSSRRLLVGTTSSSDGNCSAAFQGNPTSASNGAQVHFRRGEAATAITSGEAIGYLVFTDNADKQFAYIGCEADANAGTNDYPGRLVFSTTPDSGSSPVERVRITNAGRFNVVSTEAGIFAETTQGAGTSFVLFQGRHSATAGSVLSGTSSFQVFSNGNVQNTNNSYTAISDIKLKENVVDAGSQWADLKALRVRNYNLKEGQTHRQIGLIAQEVEPISPGLVYESPDRDAEGNDLGTTTKSVNYSVLYMKAVKALQEAMERIEQLEAEMAEVKAQLS